MLRPCWETKVARQYWWGQWVVCCVAEALSERGKESPTVTYYRMQTEAGPRFVRMTRLVLSWPPENVVRTYLMQAITAYTEIRQYWSQLPYQLGGITYHAFNILEVAGGKLWILTERKNHKLEIMFGEGSVVQAFMKEMRATGQGRNVPRCYTLPRKEVVSGVTVQDFLDWVDGPLARRWQAYNVFYANCQHYATELQEFLINPNSEIDFGAKDRTQRQRTLEQIRANPQALRLAPEEFQGDRKFVLAAVKNNWQAYLYTPEAFQRDERLAITAVEQHGLVLQSCRDELRRDRQVVLAAVKQNGLALQHASEHLRQDKEVVLAAVRQTGGALQYAAAELREDVEVAMSAGWQDPRALQYVRF